MLNLITGQPGNGKTLFTLGLVEKLRLDPASVAGNRKVYQSGIPDLTLPWEPLEDPARWFDLPDGSIVVIDECQRVFPPRKVGAAVPRHVQEFETHRHRGFDVFLVTQHPQLLDIAVRKLTGRHYHLRRTFGQEVSTVYQWEECTDPNERGKRNVALQSRFAFPKERYGWYKSAEIHTVKKELPWKPILVLVGSIIGIGLLGWFAASRLGGLKDDKQAENNKQTSVLEPDRVAAGDWSAHSFVPRVGAWLWSAPFYDQVAKVQSYPRITGCMRIDYGNGRVDCKCSNGQGDAQADEAMCHDYMMGRVFDPMRPYQDAKEANIRYLDAVNGPGQGGAGQEEGRTGTTFQAPPPSGVAGS